MRIASGAAWRLTNDTSYSSAPNYTRSVSSTNAFAVEFKPIPGWNLPTNQTVAVVPGVLITHIAFYTVTNPVMVASDLGIGITGTTGTAYRIERRSFLTSGNWELVSTNTIYSNDFNLVLPLLSLTNQPGAFYRAKWLPD